VAPADKDLHVLSKCSEVVRSVCSEAGVIMFGSRARGDAGVQSDLDLLILLPDSVADQSIENTIHRLLYNVSIDEERVIAIMIYSQSDWNHPVRRQSPFYQTVIREGIAA
jgi:uncharacterized protein